MQIRDYIIRQGLAFKLWPGDPAEAQPEGVIRNLDTSPLAGVVGPWIDIPRTSQLLDDVFIHRSGIPEDWTYWPDQSTIGIPNYYAWAYVAVYSPGDWWP